MTHTLRTASAAVVLAILVLVGSYGCGPGDSAKNKGNEVRIAANLPLTGDLAIGGASVRDGALMALEEMRKSDGKPVTLNFDWQDNAGDPKLAVSIMQKQYLNPPDIYVSGVKPQTMAIADQVRAKGTPHFVWIFDAFINKQSNNNFRTWVSYKVEPPIYLSYAQKMKPDRVAIVYVQLPHSVEEFETLVIPGLRSQGISKIYSEPFQYGKKDFKDVAVKVRNFKPDLIILNAFPEEMVALVRAFRPLGLIKDGNVICTYDMLDAGTILGADESEGIRVVAPLFVSRPDSARVRAFRASFEAKYKKEPLYTHAFGYDMALIIHDAAKRLMLPANHTAWIEALRATKIDGVTGPLTFDSDGDLITPQEVAVFRQGRPVPDESR